MDLLQIARTIWSHKLAVIPVVMLTLLGGVYVTALAPSTYEITASYVLVPPPYPPSEEQRQQDPALADVRADNPFVRFGSSSVIVDLLARRVGSGANRDSLITAGADDRFEVAPSNRFGFSSPIVDITAVASTPEAATSTARLVSASLEEGLRAMQAEQRVDDAYMYKPLLVDFPETARLRVSNKLRSLVAVLVLGAIITFMTVSVAEALAQRPSRRRRVAQAPVHLAPTSVRDKPSGKESKDRDGRLTALHESVGRH